jgi:hypothetical protein
MSLPDDIQEIGMKIMVVGQDVVDGRGAIPVCALVSRLLNAKCLRFDQQVPTFSFMIVNLRIVVHGHEVLNHVATDGQHPAQKLTGNWAHTQHKDTAPISADLLVQ